MATNMERTEVEFSSLRILLVENHHLMRRLLGEMLRGFGAREIIEATDVPEAFSLIYREPFDAVILDFFLGEMDGADFTWRIRRDPACRNRQVPILLITGLPEHQRVLKVRDAGVDSILAKPVAPKDLFVRLNTMLAQPRRFIVTKEYVGPERQPEARRSAAARLRDFPSPLTELRRRALSKVEPDDVLLLTKAVSRSGKTP